MKMKFEEAIQLLKEGKKIRRKHWSEEEYIQLEKIGETEIIDNEGMTAYYLDVYDTIFDDWEEYFEPKLKPNIEIPEEERKAFEEGFKCASKLYEKRIKELEAKRAYWVKRFKELEEEK